MTRHSSSAAAYLKKNWKGVRVHDTKIPQKLPRIWRRELPPRRSHRVQRRCAYYGLKILGRAVQDEKKKIPHHSSPQPKRIYAFALREPQIFVNEREEVVARIALKDFLLCQSARS